MTEIKNYYIIIIINTIHANVINGVTGPENIAAHENNILINY